VRDSDQVDSVLSRLVQSGTWRRLPRVAESAPENETPPAAEPEAVTPPEANEHHDDSIDNYMDRLLKRVRGQSATDAGAWKKSQPAAMPQSAPVANLSAPAQESRPEPSEDYLPRTTAPEQTLGLSAMRDVANDAARNAIETHIRKHTGRQAAGRLFTAVLIIGISSVLAWWAWRFHSQPAGIGAGVGAAAGLLSTLAALRRIASVMQLNRPTRQNESNAPEAKPA
jgi:hypothetical protein